MLFSEGEAKSPVDVIGWDMEIGKWPTGRRGGGDSFYFDVEVESAENLLSVTSVLTTMSTSTTMPNSRGDAAIMNALSSLSMTAPSTTLVSHDAAAAESLSFFEGLLRKIFSWIPGPTTSK